MARDTMFAVVMLVTNGLVGFTLLFGGWRYHTQNFNLDGVKSYLVAIIPWPCSAWCCRTSPRAAPRGLSKAMSWMLIIVSILLYGVFLLIQTRSHSHFFVDGDHEDHEDHHGPLQATSTTPLLLIAYLVGGDPAGQDARHPHQPRGARHGRPRGLEASSSPV